MYSRKINLPCSREEETSSEWKTGGTEGEELWEIKKKVERMANI